MEFKIPHPLGYDFFRGHLYQSFDIWRTTALMNVLPEQKRLGMTDDEYAEYATGELAKVIDKITQTDEYKEFERQKRERGWV